MRLTGPRWALWALRFVWGWFAVGAALALAQHLPHQVAALLEYRDPEAAGSVAGFVLPVALLRWTFRPLWPKHTA